MKRMTYRSNKMKFLIYPEMKVKEAWDCIITLTLLTTCLVTPLHIAFNPDSLSSTVFNTIFDTLFLIDILIIFNSAFYTPEMELVEDRPRIAKNYITGWFMIDIVAIIPFDLILNASEYNFFARVARFGRLYKLVKLTRLLKVLQLMRERDKLMSFFDSILQIGLGFERLIFFLFIFFILCHICACLWIIIAAL